MGTKTYWITGASSGIGEALARFLAQQGHKVAISARSAGKLEQMAQDRSTQGRLFSYPLDVTDAVATADTIKAIKNKFGRIDCAILNAGTYLPDTGVTFSADSFRRQHDINVHSVALALDQLLPLMREQGGGHIVIVASVAGYSGLPRSVAYSSSKAALIAMAEALKLDCDDMNIKLQLICPGFVKTPLTDRNEFPMPFLISADEAVAAIAKGLDSNKFEIAFPRPMALMMKFLRYLPYRLFFAALRSSTGAGPKS